MKTLKAVISCDDGEWIVAIELDGGSSRFIYQAFSHSDAIKYCEHHGYKIYDDEPTEKSCLYHRDDFFISDYGVF